MQGTDDGHADSKERFVTATLTEIRPARMLPVGMRLNALPSAHSLATLATMFSFSEER